MNDYFDPSTTPVKKSNGCAIASLVCGILSFICNPLSLLSIATLVCAIIALTGRNQGGKGMAIAGLCLFGLNLIYEFILACLSLGMTLLF